MLGGCIFTLSGNVFSPSAHGPPDLPYLCTNQDAVDLLDDLTGLVGDREDIQTLSIALECLLHLEHAGGMDSNYLAAHILVIISQVISNMTKYDIPLVGLKRDMKEVLEKIELLCSDIRDNIYHNMALRRTV